MSMPGGDDVATAPIPSAGSDVVRPGDPPPRAVLRRSSRPRIARVPGPAAVRRACARKRSESSSATGTAPRTCRPSYLVERPSRSDSQARLKRTIAPVGLRTTTSAPTVSRIAETRLRFAWSAASARLRSVMSKPTPWMNQGRPSSRRTILASHWNQTTRPSRRDHAVRRSERLARQEHLGGLDAPARLILRVDLVVPADRILQPFRLARTPSPLRCAG